MVLLSLEKICKLTLACSRSEEENIINQEMDILCNKAFGFIENLALSQSGRRILLLKMKRRIEQNID